MSLNLDCVCMSAAGLRTLLNPHGSEQLVEGKHLGFEATEQEKFTVMCQGLDTILSGRRETVALAFVKSSNGKLDVLDEARGIWTG